MNPAEFVDNGNAPEFFPGGVLFREPAFTYVTPTDAIGSALALTVDRLGASIIIPAFAGTARRLLGTH